MVKEAKTEIRIAMNNITNDCVNIIAVNKLNYLQKNCTKYFSIAANLLVIISPCGGFINGIVHLLYIFNASHYCLNRTFTKAKHMHILR